MATRWRWPPESWLGLAVEEMRNLQRLGNFLSPPVALVLRTLRISMPKAIFCPRSCWDRVA